MDAFTEAAFKGNPAAVCWLEDIEKDDKWLQSVATEFNLSETCYLTPIVDHGSENPRFHLRWFTPVAEVINSFAFLSLFRLSFAFSELLNSKISSPYLENIRHFYGKLFRSKLD